MKKSLDIFLILILLLFFSVTGTTQEDKFTYLIENGSKMIRGNDFEKVFSIVRELPPEKKADFRVRVIENFAYLKGYLVVKNKEYGKKWKVDYKPILYTKDKSATPILVELLRDGDPHMRGYTVYALGYIGDERALNELKRVSQQDENGKVRLRAMGAYDQIAAIKPSTEVAGETLEDEIKPQLSPEMTAFIGKWEGSWDNRKDMKFILTIPTVEVESAKVEYESKDLKFSEKAKFISGGKPRIEWMFARTASVSGYRSQAIWFTFELQEDGRLKGDFEDRTFPDRITRKAILTKVD